MHEVRLNLTGTLVHYISHAGLARKDGTWTTHINFFQKNRTFPSYFKNEIQQGKASIKVPNNQMFHSYSP